ncbi:MAG TPA: gamma-glutamylcyclotransferase family protein [Pirellulales bacterium]|nr:gamma-glutamylcyclotransferase family protein [Pirellulales bacterium]
MSTDYLFVYGTLRPPATPPELQALLAPLGGLGRATTAGVLYDLGKYPGAVFSGSGKIVGEVLELPDSERLLAALDEYEGFDPDDLQGSLYLRVRRSVTLADGRSLDCWAYAYNRDVTGCATIPGGDYTARDK